MNFIVVTGLSGAGKSYAIASLEDIGFYCVDNLPPPLIPAFYDLCNKSDDPSRHKVAIVTDIRGGKNFDTLFDSLNSLQEQGKPYKMLFLEASDNVIIRRYRETRRRHPLAEIYSGSIPEAIALERKTLKPLREFSDYIIDTSLISTAQLKERISGLFLENPESALMINCMSFGFKYGSPSESDLIFDVRCFPNPYYDENLKNLTGLDEPVRDFVMKKKQTQIFMEKLFSLIDFMLPLYSDEGKSQLVIAIGCTGGKHRSVSISQQLYFHLKNLEYRTSIYHRDMKKQ